MRGAERVIAVIPARGGSKSILKKNLSDLHGKPLVAWAIELARSIPEIDRVIVSTDDTDIAGVSKAHGAEVYMRPPEMASDTALVIDAIRNLIERLQAEGESSRCMVLLEPTAALRTREDIVQCLDLLFDERKNYGSIATFHEAHLNPYRAWKFENDEAKKFLEESVVGLPRQLLPKAYQLNGNGYAFWTDRIPADSTTILNGRIGAVVVPKERSFEVDDSFDLEIIRWIFPRIVGTATAPS